MTDCGWAPGTLLSASPLNLVLHRSETTQWEKLLSPQMMHVFTFDTVDKTPRLSFTCLEDPVSCVTVGNVYSLGQQWSQGRCSVSLRGLPADTYSACPPLNKPAWSSAQRCLVLFRLVKQQWNGCRLHGQTFSHNIWEAIRCFTPNWIVLINIQRQLVVQQTQHLIEHLRQTTLIHKDLRVAQTLWQAHWLRGMWHSTQPRRNEVTLSHLEERTEAG